MTGVGCHATLASMRWVALLGVMYAAPAFAEPPARTWCFGAFGQIAPVLAAFDYVADGHGPSEKRAFDVGVGGNVSRCGGVLELGLGLRYDRSSGGDDVVHLIAAPVWIAARARITATTTLRFGAGIGPGAGFVAGYPNGSTLITLGPEVEAWIGVIHSSGISIEVGVRVDKLTEINTDDPYLDGGDLVHAQLPVVRIGATWQ